MRKEIESRLIKFSSLVIRMEGQLLKGESSEHLFNQVMRSSTSAALNYGEALGAESRKDFTHKIGIVLKELRESYNNLRVIRISGIYKGNTEDLENIIDECNQLIAIFHKTALSLKNNNKST